MTDKKLKVAFIHPDLGIGGAERLVVDAAVGLTKKHDVTVFTSHHNPNHCFKETIDGTLDVKVFGDFLPRTIFGYMHVLCTIIRMLYVAFIVVFWYGKFDVIICDQVSHHIPILKWFSRSKIVFYCHHPDKLLVRGTMHFLKKLYRIPFDYWEEVTTRMADYILVNSIYTRTVFKSSFPSIKVTPEVLYPALNLQSYDEKPNEKPTINLSGKRAIVSVNRFEKKKGIGLAVETFAELRKRLPPSEFEKLVLILAGGYDERLQENREVLAELKERVKELDLEKQTIYLPSFSTADRYVLFHESEVILYTPINEHFGIVPIEAQYCKTCVVAANSGGPLESIIHGKTGYLADPTPEAFAEAALIFMQKTDEQKEELRKKAREHVKKNFSLEAFSAHLEKVIDEVVG
jgi:alpha-1,3/alpha-1,6-mannosyltransferase